MEKLTWPEKLRYFRLKAGLTQERLAWMMGVAALTVEKLEQGKNSRSRELFETWVEIEYAKRTQSERRIEWIGDQGNHHGSGEEVSRRQLVSD